MDDRLQQRIHFILELDPLKAVVRRSYLLNQERRENSAEHSWHVAMLANVLAEYADEPVDIARVTKMLLLHDIVEIDAGDTMVYDLKARKAKAEKEAAPGRRTGFASTGYWKRTPRWKRVRPACGSTFGRRSRRQRSAAISRPSVYISSSSSAFASFRSGVSKPSLNQPQIGTNRERALPLFCWRCQSRAREVTARSSRVRAACF